MSKKKHLSHEIQSINPVQHWVKLVIMSAVMLAVIAALTAWIYHSARLWRAQSLARQATELMDQGKPAEAEAKLVAAYHLASTDISVLRASARCEEALQSPNSLDFYRELLKSPKATKQDQRNALRASLFFDKVALANDLLTKLKAAGALEADDVVCEAQVRWAQNKPVEATTSMHKALEMSPNNRPFQLLLAQMLASLPDDNGQAEAMTLFRQLSQGKDGESLQALIAISRSTGLDKTVLQQVLTLLQQHPLLNDDGRYAAWELEARLGNKTPTQVLQAVVDHYQSANLPEKARAARWLYGHNQPGLVLKLAPLDQALLNQDLFLARLDSLGLLKNWKEVQAELNNPKAPLTEVFLFLYRARTAQELGDTAGSQSNWERARSAASAQPGMLKYLGTYAYNLHLYDEAKKTYLQMTKMPGQQLEGYHLLLALEADHGSGDEVLETLEQMMVDFPDKPEVKSDWAYQSLLLNTNVLEARQTAEILVQAHPELLAYRSVLALAYLRTGHAADAARLYDGKTVDWDNASSSWKLVYAAVLKSNGKSDAARKIAQSINHKQLRPLEQAILEATFPDNRK